jgi:starch synthase
MKILHIASEVAPFAKTGGLGDVLSALPKALANKGHDVRVVLPFYRRVREGGHHAERILPWLELDLGRRRHRFSTYETKIPGSNVPVYLVDAPPLYDRPGIYTQDPDEHVRFALLGWAALRIAQQLRFAPDIVHVHDWQASLVPMTLRYLFAWDRLFDRARTVLTIHNIGHQGGFGSNAVDDVGLAPARGELHQDQLHQGRLSFLLHGIMYANAITTVSPTYAREIMTPEHGVGLDGFLRARRDVTFGILNGIDDTEWNPSVDRHLAQRYSMEELAYKETNKKALLAQVGLPYAPRVPVIGIVSRLAWQKGFDLCVDVLPSMLAQPNVQLVVLGSGEPRYEQFFSHLARVRPMQVAFANKFSEPLAHRIEAGADMFLMPSRYEPCGLNQMYSLAYGTPPIVHRTGGLADTVSHWDARTGRGNGFVFEHFDARGLAWALRKALGTWDDKAAWRAIQLNGMRQDFSWTRRVADYEAVYRSIAA